MRDNPDFRDYSLERKEIADVIAQMPEQLAKEKALLEGGGDSLPSAIDWRGNCSTVEDQERLGSCTAQAVVGLVEYLIRRKRGTTELSRLFLYKVTRNLMELTGDSGASIRATIKAVATFGVPPEQYWPYVIPKFEEEPSAFLYSFAKEFQALRYVRADGHGDPPHEILDRVKLLLSAGFPVAFGFVVYSSLNGAADIPFPRRADSIRGGHAVLAVGYDDQHETADGKTVPSLIIRNSWGMNWGDGGYGYLPYEFVERGLAFDFWTILNQEWLNEELFD